jgi:hypothetical protein
MALTIAKVTGADYVSSNKRVRVRTVTFDASYATGGLSLTPALVGLRTIDTVHGGIAKNAAGTSALPVAYDFTAQKLQAYRYDGASAGKAFLEEVTAAVDLSAFSVRLTFTGS